MPTSIAAVLRKRKTKANTFPLAIRITKDGKSNYIYIGKNIKETYWDSAEKKVKSSYPNSARLNNLIKKKLVEAEDILLQAQSNKTDTSALTIKNKIKAGDESTSFFDLAKEYIDVLKKTGKYNQVSSDQPKVNHFREFLGGEDISIQNIDTKLLEKYSVFLKAEYGNGTTTIYNKLNFIRIMCNRAKGRGLVEPKLYPFGKEGGIKMKPTNSQKIGLNEEEIKKIEQYKPIEGTTRWHSKNVFLFSFYLAGMRVSDLLLLRWSQIVDGRLYYKMGKNEKPGSVKLPDKAMSIIELYKADRKDKNDFIFPEMKKADLKNPKDIARKIATAAKKFGTHLKNIAKELNISKKISMHIARHTFGNISKGNIPPDILQMLYRHTHLSTTVNYQNNFIHEKTDAALDEVLDF